MKAKDIKGRNREANTLGSGKASHTPSVQVLKGSIEERERQKELNAYLRRENELLYNELRELCKARVCCEPVGYKEFLKVFPDDSACLHFLEQIKWGETFSCRRCGHHKYCAGRHEYSRRCTKCRYEESATVFTLLHSCKFPLTKAFYMLYLIHTSHFQITSQYLSDTVGVRQSTCWGFRKKVLDIWQKTQKEKGKRAAIETSSWTDLLLER